MPPTTKSGSRNQLLDYYRAIRLVAIRLAILTARQVACDSDHDEREQNKIKQNKMFSSPTLHSACLMRLSSPGRSTEDATHEPRLVSTICHTHPARRSKRKHTQDLQHKTSKQNKSTPTGVRQNQRLWSGDLFDGDRLDNLVVIVTPLRLAHSSEGGVVPPA